MTTFHIEAHYPHPILSLSLRGDGCGLNWDSGIHMTKISDNTWAADVTCQSSTEVLQMKVLQSDKTWMIGANHFANVRSTNSTNIYPWFNTYQGSLTVIDNVHSSEMGNNRSVIVYTPPSYMENTLKVHKNVLVMHDGQNLFNTKTAFMGNAWMCQNSLDQSIVGGTTEEILVVAPYNTSERMDEYTYVQDPEYGGGKGDLYLDFLESTIIPLAQLNFRVEISRDTLGILGSSLGGLISCYAGWTRSDVYGKVGCMSSSFWWDNQDFQTNLITKSTPA